MICAVERLILQVQASSIVRVRNVTFVGLCRYVQIVGLSLSFSLSCSLFLSQMPVLHLRLTIDQVPLISFPEQ